MPYCSNCGTLKTRLNRQKVCNECNNQNTTNDDDENSLEDAATGLPEGNVNFWSQMDRLLETKFTKFEEKVNNSVKEEIQKATEPMKTELAKLTEENTKLNTELTVLKAKQKKEEERNDKITKVLKEHHKTLARSDKDDRAKRLILAGVPEGQITINQLLCKNDNEKVKAILSLIQEDIVLVQCRRIGAKDQGAGNRPRFIQLEFSSIADRNTIKKESEKLKDHEATKEFYVKPDRTKK